MPAPAITSPGKKSQRLEVTWAVHAIYAIPTAKSVRPATRMDFAYRAASRAATAGTSNIGSGRGGDPEPIEAVTRARAQVGNQQEGKDERDQADGQIHVEDPPPTEVGDDEAPQHRTEQDGQTGERAVDGEHATAPLGGKEGGHDGQALGCEDRRAEALGAACEDELGGILGQPAEG